MNMTKQKISCLSGMLCISTGLSIHEPSNTRNQSDSTSEGEHVTSQLAATSIATLEQGESSKGIVL
jgi:hypothetical protein